MLDPFLSYEVAVVSQWPTSVSWTPRDSPVVVKNPLKLSLEEIETWEEFQDLVQAFFMALAKRDDNQVKNVRAKKTGRGGDGKRDILVDMDMHDGIQAFNRRWVVQCKASDPVKRTGKNAVDGVRDLLDRYNANGYLLICKGRASSGLTQLLEDLESSDQLGRCYVYWDGDQFRTSLYEFTELVKKYFPLSHAAIEAKRAKASAEVDKLLKE